MPQVFSAALIGYVETRYADDETKNALCQVAPHPEFTRDWIRVQITTTDNTNLWLQKFPLWVLRSRLSFAAHESALAVALAGIRLRKDVAALTGLPRKLERQEFPDSEHIEPSGGQPPGEIVKDVWASRAAVDPGPGFSMDTRMTILRLGDGSLLLHSPVALSDAQATAIDRLGTVRHLVSPNLLHHRYLEQATRRWPDARVWAAPGLAEKAPDLRIDEVLASGSPWPGIDVLEISGWPRLQEFVFSHRPSGTLLVTDLLFNEPTAHNLPTRLFLRAGGAYGRFAVSRFMKSMVAAKAAFADSLRPLLELPVERIVMAHGEVLETDARTRLRTLLSPFVRQPAIQGQ